MNLRRKYRNDQRYWAFYSSICQLTIPQIARILENLEDIVYDEHFFDNSTGKW